MLDLRFLSIGKSVFYAKIVKMKRSLTHEKSTSPSCVSGYESLSANILAFHELEAIHMKLSEDLLGTQQGLHLQG